MINLGVLVSGKGTNLQSILDAIDAGHLDARVAVVVSNNPEALALERAKSRNIPVEILPNTACPSREEYDRKIAGILKGHRVDLIILAGFMKIITAELINAFPMQIMNIHPALLPAFPGLNVQKKALEYGARFSGATVHFIDEGIDTGPIIIQAVVPVHGEDTVETLSSRILAEEHLIYPEAIQLFSEQRLTVEGRKVIIKDHQKPDGVMENPSVRLTGKE